jgi:hypothetical protein
MGARTHRMRVKHGLLIGLLTAGACFAVTAPLTFSGESRSAPSGQTQTGSGASGSYQPAEKPAAVSSAPGMTIYIDAQTGALLKEPAPGAVPLQLTPELQNAFSTSDQGLVEVPSSVAGRRRQSRPPGALPEPAVRHHGCQREGQDAASPPDAGGR